MPTALGSGALPLRAERPVPTRFVEGYEPFETYLRANGADPARLAADLSALWTFLDGRDVVLESASLADAAARFAGNVIAMMHPAATWRLTTEPEIGTQSRSIPVTGLVRMMIEHPERRDPFIADFESWEQDDRDHDELRRIMRGREEHALVEPPIPFERPPFPEQVFRDDSGRIIDYGSRWPDHEAPPEAYSRVSNPGRFVPLLLDVAALIRYLATVYQVEVHQTDTEDGARVVRFRPAAGAPITLTATSESVRIEAGVLLREVLPDCSCDACDETAESAAQNLEDLLLAVASGGLQEQYPLGRGRWLRTRLCLPGGGGRGSGGDPDHRLTPAQLAEGAAVLRDLPGGWWPAWPLRATTT